MEATTDFNEWLEEHLSGGDYNDVYSLYHTVSDGKSMGSFSISENNGTSFIEDSVCDGTLMLASEKAKETFLQIIEDNYCGGMDIEGFYYYHHSMEKDD